MIIPPIRGTDCHGSGAYGAKRGKRRHNGIDLACFKGSLIKSLTHGIVNKLGYPYNPSDPKKGHLRYVEVGLDGNRYRYFYIDPCVAVGDIIEPGMIIGEAQGLCDIYKGITDHIHFEHINATGAFSDPEGLLK